MAIGYYTRYRNRRIYGFRVGVLSSPTVLQGAELGCNESIWLVPGTIED